jgi:hypothetical protein
MKKRTRAPSKAALAVRIQRLTYEVEKLVPELKTALASDTDPPTRGLVISAVSALERAATAVKRLVDESSPHGPSALREILEGTSPLMSLLGSRVVLARAGGSTPTPATPSAGAQALAVLLEDPSRTFEAAEIAERLGCSTPVARTTLNRLVQSGHATRPAAGKFRAKAR